MKTIGVTMGDPAGIGAEIIVKAFKENFHNDKKLFVLGDASFLKKLAKSAFKINKIKKPSEGLFQKNCLDVLSLSNLKNIKSGKPNIATSKAMIRYIDVGVELAIKKKIDVIVTCPINKLAMKKAGSKFAGHTEFLANKTKTKNYAMMLAGEKLKVCLVSIHIPLKDVAKFINKKNILKTIKITNNSLKKYFKIRDPKIAVAALNPHAGENGLFGNEEKKILQAVLLAKKEKIKVSEPLPPDSVFYRAKEGEFDAVVCMYHDQGLIPFKLIHFNDGVNLSLGLPIVRTSVDHGTAYDIAGKNIASPLSLISAVNMGKQIIS